MRVRSSRDEAMVSRLSSGSDIVAVRALISDTSTELGRAKTWGVRSIKGFMVVRRNVVWSMRMACWIVEKGPGYTILIRARTSYREEYVGAIDRMSWIV